MPRLTVMLPADLLEEIRSRVDRGNISSWVAQAVAERLGRERLAGRVVADGPLSRRAGELLATSGTADVLDALVALVAQDRPLVSMTLITVAATKGGVGKTTLAYELAAALGGVLVDLEWDGGSATAMWGYDPGAYRRVPLLDAFEAGPEGARPARAASGCSSCRTRSPRPLAAPAVGRGPRAARR